MRSKTFVVQSILQMPEKWAKRCQVPGQSPSSHVGAETEDRKEYRAWVTTWWVCQMLVTGLLLVALMGCGGSGSSGSMGGNPPVPNAVPSISSVTPPNTNAGNGGLTIVVVGQGFVSTSTLLWNGSNRATTDMSATQLTANLTAADVAAAGAAQITVVNAAPGGGTSNPVGFVINGTAAAPVPGFVYVINQASSGQGALAGTILGFSVDASTGGLAPVPGSPFAVLAGPTALTADLSGKFLYVASDLNNLTPTNDISAFAIDPNTGALTPVAGSPFVSGLNPLNLAVDSTDKFLYVADDGNGTITDETNISVFSINATTGALTPISQDECANQFGVPTESGAIVTDPVAGFVFVTSTSQLMGEACSFSINPAGSLQEVTSSPFLLGTTTDQFGPGVTAVVDPFGKFFYTGNGANLSALSINASSGALSPVPGSPFSIVSSALGMDPLGRFLYTTDSDTGAVSSSSIDTNTGAPTILPGFAPVVARPLALDPSGKFLYGVMTANPPFSISAFAIDETTGLLTPVAGPPVALPAGVIPLRMIVTRKAQ
jgi:Lactonase, 7-bladed beta-propeller/IPT/TIG domain